MSSNAINTYGGPEPASSAEAEGSSTAVVLVVLSGQCLSWTLSLSMLIPRRQSKFWFCVKDLPGVDQLWAVAEAEGFNPSKAVVRGCL